VELLDGLFHEAAQFHDRLRVVVDLQTEHDVIMQPHAAILFDNQQRSDRWPLVFSNASTMPFTTPSPARMFPCAVQNFPDADGDTLVTGGAYSWLRNPIYLAFLVMLLATGFLISGGIKLILPVLLYLAGSELRIASEEGELAEKFPEGHAMYRSRTRWRYLPGLR
jgi:hypothetical protein